MCGPFNTTSSHALFQAGHYREWYLSLPIEMSSYPLKVITYIPKEQEAADLPQFREEHFQINAFDFSGIFSFYVMLKSVTFCRKRAYITLTLTQYLVRQFIYHQKTWTALLFTM